MKTFLFAVRSNSLHFKLNFWRESGRLQTLLLCLKGVAQDRAVNSNAVSCSDLLQRMNQWYASAADISLLEDAIRSKLEYTCRGKSELLPDYILRYSQYWDLAKTLPESCGFSERICARMFIRTLSVTDEGLLAEVLRNKGYSCDSLQSAFDLTLDSAKTLRMIQDASRSFGMSAGHFSQFVKE